MKGSRVRFFWLLGGAVLAGLLQQCSGTNPAAPPAPLAELPGALLVPDARIDVSEIASVPAPEGVSFLVGSGGRYSDEIAIAPNRIGDTNLNFGLILAPLEDLRIPVGEDVTRFVSSIEVPDFPVPRRLEVRLDFADFDYDGDGAREGCSGHTAALPVCLRMWSGGERFIAAVFDQFPSEVNRGAGRLKFLFNSQVSGGGGDTGVRFAFVYDHFDPEDLFTEIALFIPPESFALGLRRAQISQVGPEGSAKKTINFSDKFDFGRPKPSTVRYVGSFRQDFDFWSGSLLVSEDLLASTPELSNFKGICAQISSGNGVLIGTCRDLGIDVKHVPFIDFVEERAFEFFDFPATPTI